MQKELNSLDSSITTMINDAKITSEIATQSLLSIQDDIDDSNIHAQSLIDQTEIMINTDIEEINKISVTGVEALDKLIPMTDTLAGAIELMGKGLSTMKSAIYYMNRAMDESEYISDLIKGMPESLELPIEYTKAAIEDLKSALDIIFHMIDLIYNDETGEILEEIKIDKVTSQLKSHLESADTNLKKAVNNLDYIFNDFKNVIASIEDTGRFMGYSLDYMIDAMNVMDKSMIHIADIFKGFSDLLTFLTDQGGLEFATSNDLYQKTKEDLFGSIDDVSVSLSEFITNVNVQGDILMESAMWTKPNLLAMKI